MHRLARTLPCCSPRVQGPVDFGVTAPRIHPMTTTNERMLEALERALGFEDDGVSYYEAAMGKAGNDMARDVLKVLRDEEVKHKLMISEIHAVVSKEAAWTAEPPKPAPMPSFVSVFRQKGGRMPKKAASSDVAALEHALDIEARGRTMYEELAKAAATEPERRFYEMLGAEERTHLTIIEDSLEYLADPEGWYGTHERSGLDGA